MIINEEINKQLECLNEYQGNFIDTTMDLFKLVKSEKIKENSFVNYNAKSGILEICLEHMEVSEMSIVFLIHKDMIEISCLGFEFYLDSIKKALFSNVPENEFRIKVKEFTAFVLKGKFKVNLYSNKKKIVESELVWDENKYPSSKKTHTVLNFLNKKKVLEKEEVNIKSFI